MRSRDIDKIYSQALGKIVDFRFDEQVAKVFPDMINRSVPGYASIIQMIGTLADQYAQSDSNCYDLGCSLGAASLSIRHHLKAPNCRIISVDNSQPMLDRFQSLLEEDSADTPVELMCADVRDVDIHKASLVVLNFTLQFVPLADRQRLINKIFAGMLPGGILVLSEKISFDDPNKQQMLTDLHHAFKRSQGYSDLEISQKRTALENVLIPETLDAHISRLTQAGFQQSHMWFQCFNFMSLVAVR
ncbi:MAG: carboxy-S-adenosyl-L-methionine synthase CmoA [Gammaproteobacteria bacterium]|nr:carboxy-S-adenosyl-L-methionine synthase CmoA [Gammaproteobacteria bacterium]